MSEKPPSGTKKSGKKGKKLSSSSPKTPKSRKSSSSSPRPIDSESTVRTPLSGKSCLSHKKDLNFYSTSQERLICEDCINPAEMSRFPKVILPKDEAFRVRLTSLYSVLNNYIIPKKAQIEAQKLKVETCLNSVKSKKNEIEKDMKGEFSAMNERLNFSFGTKYAVLTHELRELNVDLDRIQHIMNILESSANDQVTFLQRSADLKALIDLSSSKPIKYSVDVDSTDMPKEVKKVREIVTEFQALKNLISIKDEMIWKLIHEKPSLKEINETTSRELAEWARLSERYTQELKKFQINCEYCSCPLTQETVNSNCGKNTRAESRGKLSGTGRHFFSDGKRGREVSPAVRDGDVSLKDISRIVKFKMMPLQKIMMKEDGKNEGVIGLKSFIDILESALDLNADVCQGLGEKFRKKGGVDYLKFLRKVYTEVILEGKKEMLEHFKSIDQDLDGVVSTSEFLVTLAKFGVNLENCSIFKDFGGDDDGNVEYLIFINYIVKKSRGKSN